MLKNHSHNINIRSYDSLSSSDDSFNKVKVILEVNEPDFSIDYINDKLNELQNSLHGSIRSFEVEYFEYEYEYGSYMIEFVTNMKPITVNNKISKIFSNCNVSYYLILGVFIMIKT